MYAIDINRVYALVDAYKSGRLGGEKMPEDENPGLDKKSKENYLYFTLPMALNYQRIPIHYGNAPIKHTMMWRLRMFMI